VQECPTPEKTFGGDGGEKRRRGGCGLDKGNGSLRNILKKKKATSALGKVFARGGIS